MLKKAIKFLPIFILTALALCGFFSVVSAQTQISLSSPIGDAKSPAEMVGNLYKFSLLVAGASAFAVMIYGAVLYTASAGNSSKQQDAREWIMGAIWGVVLLLSAYLILYTINPNLVNLTNPALEKIDVSSLQTQPGAPAVTEEMRLEDEENRSVFASYGIKINKPFPATQLSGLRGETIQEVLDISAKVGNLSVIVTGGTEATGGHSESSTGHLYGYKVDLATNPVIDKYIKDNFTDKGIRESDGAKKYQSPSGAIYALESNHWDVSVQ
jgi:hypothetical protein